MDICPPTGVDNYEDSDQRMVGGRRGNVVDLALYSLASFLFVCGPKDRNQPRWFHLYLSPVQVLCFADEVLFCGFEFYGLWRGVRS